MVPSLVSLPIYKQNIPYYVPALLVCSSLVPRLRLNFLGRSLGMRLVCSKKCALVLQATCSQIQFLQYVETGRKGVFASWKHQGGEGLGRWLYVANMCWWTNLCVCGEPGCSGQTRRSTLPGGPQPPTDSEVTTHSQLRHSYSHQSTRTLVSQNAQNGNWSVCLHNTDLST